MKYNIWEWKWGTRIDYELQSINMYLITLGGLTNIDCLNLGVL